MKVVPGKLFDSVHAPTTSERWRVLYVDPTGYVILQRVGRRVGPPPRPYLVGGHRGYRVGDRFDGWPLEEIPPGTVKSIRVETLLKNSDYIPVDHNALQRGLFE